MRERQHLAMAGSRHLHLPRNATAHRAARANCQLLWYVPRLDWRCYDGGLAVDTSGRVVLRDWDDALLWLESLHLRHSRKSEDVSVEKMFVSVCVSVHLLLATRLLLTRQEAWTRLTFVGNLDVPFDESAWIQIFWSENEETLPNIFGSYSCRSVLSSLKADSPAVQRLRAAVDHWIFRTFLRGFSEINFFTSRRCDDRQEDAGTTDIRGYCTSRGSFCLYLELHLYF